VISKCFDVLNPNIESYLKSYRNVTKWMELGLFVVTSSRAMMFITMVLIWIVMYDNDKNNNVGVVVPLACSSQAMAF